MGNVATNASLLATTVIYAVIAILGTIGTMIYVLQGRTYDRYFVLSFVLFLLAAISDMFGRFNHNFFNGFEHILLLLSATALVTSALRSGTEPVSQR